MEETKVKVKVKLLWGTKIQNSSIRVTRKHWPPVHGPTLRTGSADYLRTGPRTTPTDPLTDHPPNSTKNKIKDFTYCFSKRSLVSAKFRALRWVKSAVKCNRPGFSLRRKVIIVHCYFLCCGYNYAWKTGKTLGSLKICAAFSAFPPPFRSAYSPAGSLTRPRLHNLLGEISNINKFIERLKITSFAARLSYKQKVRTFFPLTIGIFSPKTALVNIVLGVLYLHCRIKI